MEKQKHYYFLKTIIILMSFVMVFGINILYMFIVKDEGNFGKVLLADLVEMIVLIGIILLWAKILPGKFPAVNDYRFKRPTVYQVMMALGIAMISLTAVYRLIYILHGGDAKVAMVPVTYGSKMEFQEELVGSIHAVLIAPALEEMGFRIIPASVVQTKKRRIIVLAILAIIFASMHPRNIRGALVDAAVFCVVFLVTRNPMIPILCHAFNNLLKTLAGAVAYIGLTDVSMADGGTKIVLFSTPVTIGMVVAGTALILPEIIHSRRIKALSQY